MGKTYFTVKVQTFGTDLNKIIRENTKLRGSRLHTIQLYYEQGIEMYFMVFEEDNESG